MFSSKYAQISLELQFAYHLQIKVILRWSLTIRLTVCVCLYLRPLGNAAKNIVRESAIDLFMMVTFEIGL